MPGAVVLSGDGASLVCPGDRISQHPGQVVLAEGSNIVPPEIGTERFSDWANASVAKKHKVSVQGSGLPIMGTDSKFSPCPYPGLRSHNRVAKV